MVGFDDAHQQPVNTQGNTRTVRQPSRQSGEETFIQGRQRQILPASFCQILLKALPLLPGIGQFVKSVRQLHSVQIEFESFS